jgi:hypothetical protein
MVLYNSTHQPSTSTTWTATREKQNKKPLSKLEQKQKEEDL